MTQFFAVFAHDADFTLMLNKGVSILKKQIKTLEELMSQYEIPLPERHPKNMHSPIDPETMEDIFLYRTIMRGLQEAMDLHLRAVVEATHNDTLRATFRDFLSDEISLFNMFLKYGKSKGWTHVAPTYTVPT